MLDSKLLCTFCYPNELESTLQLISNHYTVVGSKVWVLTMENDEQYALTYNVEIGNIRTKLSNTIVINRDKENNVLYTIDALEKLNKKFNGIDWSNYQRSLILTRSGELCVIGTKLKTITNLN